MFAKIADLIRAGVAWHDLYVRDREVSREEARESWMATYLSASVSDPMMFDSLLNNIKQEEAWRLYHRLNSRVNYFGTILSRRDQEAYDTLVWSRNEVERLLHRDAKKID
jgi:hypothetical protein